MARLEDGAAPIAVRLALVNSGGTQLTASSPTVSSTWSRICLSRSITTTQTGYVFQVNIGNLRGAFFFDDATITEV